MYGLIEIGDKITTLGDRIRQRIRHALGIEELQNDVQRAEAEVKSLREELMRYATVDADLAYHPKDTSTVILMGRYKGQAYVQFHDVTSDAFVEVVDHVRFLAKHRQARYIDAPPVFRHVF